MNKAPLNTDFTSLLGDIVEYLKDDAWWVGEELKERCRTALNELEDIDPDDDGGGSTK